MSSPSDARSPVELLADEFLPRCKRGEKPTIKEYCDRHPDLAEEIRDVFEAVLMVEDLKPGTDDAQRLVRRLRARQRQTPRTGRRLPHSGRDRPRRHGRRLRGRAAGAGKARGPQGAAQGGRGRTARRRFASSAKRRPRRGCTTPTSCRSSTSARTASTCTTRCS